MRSRQAQKPVDIKIRKDWPSFPKATISGMAAGAVAWFSRLEFDYNTTRAELIAEVTKKVMESQHIVRGAKVCWTEFEQVRILKTSHPRFSVREYPHIETYNCILCYPKTMTKAELIENVAEIASTWCPKACLARSPDEIIWPEKDDSIEGFEK